MRLFDDRDRQHQMPTRGTAATPTRWARGESPRRRRLSAGFTLIEIAVVLSIAVIVTGITIAALHQIKTRNSYSTTVAGLMVSLHKVRADAFATGATSVFVVNQNTGQYWGIEDRNNNFDITTFDPANPAPAPDVLLFANTLTAPIVFGPSTGYGANPLPQPFAWVHAGNACTFCIASGYGSISFQAGSPAVFSGPNAADGSLTIQTQSDSGIWSTTTFAIVGRTSAIDTFEGTHG